MSADAEAPKKHRHELGLEDHGPVMAAGTTRAIQIILGMWIVGTLALVVYTLVAATRPSSTPIMNSPAAVAPAQH